MERAPASRRSIGGLVSVPAPEVRPDRDREDPPARDDEHEQRVGVRAGGEHGDDGERGGRARAQDHRRLEEVDEAHRRRLQQRLEQLPHPRRAVHERVGGLLELPRRLVGADPDARRRPEPALLHERAQARRTRRCRCGRRRRTPRPSGPRRAAGGGCRGPCRCRRRGGPRAPCDPSACAGPRPPRARRRGAPPAPRPPRPARRASGTPRWRACPRPARAGGAARRRRRRRRTAGCAPPTRRPRDRARPRCRRGAAARRRGCRCRRSSRWRRSAARPRPGGRSRRRRTVPARHLDQQGARRLGDRRVIGVADDRSERPVHVEQDAGTCRIRPEGLECLAQRRGGGHGRSMARPGDDRWSCDTGYPQVGRGRPGDLG